MFEKKPNVTLQAAQELLGHIPEPLNSKLKTLLDRAEKGENITIKIINLLNEHDNVRLWMKERTSTISGIKNSTLRGYTLPPGDLSSIPASQKWVCPKSSCYEWFLVIQEGGDPPKCEIHNIEMVRQG